MWTVADISFALIADMTDDPVVTVSVQTPVGVLMFTAEPVVEDKTLILQRTHVQASRRNAVGHANLMVIARAVMERMDYDGLVIEGSIRTTGANPGHRPHTIWFSRGVRFAPSGGSGSP